MQQGSTFVLALAVGLLVPSLALADPPRALMMAPLGDAPTEVTESAVAEVRATLEHQGVVFVSPPRGLALRCETLECRAEALRRAGAVVAVTVLVWQPTSFRAEGRVEVALTDVLGETVGAQEDFAADETLAAVHAARAALANFGTQGRIAMEITGVDGAAVLVDGRPVGTLPYRGSLASGRHRVRVVANGQVLLTRQFTLEPGAEPIVLRVGPESSGESATSGDEAGEGPSASSREGADTVSLAAGASLGAIGVGALTWVVVAATRTGCDARNGAGECTRETQLQKAPAAVLGVLGAVALGAGVGLIVRSRRRPGSPEVSAQIAPTSASLRVTF